MELQPILGNITYKFCRTKGLKKNESVTLNIILWSCSLEYNFYK